MIKGVSRQIVDIPQPESAFFERAIFFVKPEYASFNESKLRARANEMVKDAADPPLPQTGAKRKKVAKFLHLVLCAAAGSALTLTVQLLFKLL